VFLLGWEYGGGKGEGGRGKALEEFASANPLEIQLLADWLFKKNFFD
jgi:hypothetical protein